MKRFPFIKSVAGALVIAGVTFAQVPIGNLPPANLPLQPADKIVVNQIVGGLPSTRAAPISAVTSIIPTWALTGILKGNGTAPVGVAGFNDVVNLWSGVCTPSPSDFLATDGTCQTATSVSGANPTATIGLTAVNGVATTYTRSDGAPALSQAISPTWTGTHLWTGASDHTIASSHTSLGSLDSIWVNSGAAANAHIWRTDVGTTQWTLGAVNDAFSVERNAIQFTRTAGAITNVLLGNSIDLSPITVNGTTIPTCGSSTQALSFSASNTFGCQTLAPAGVTSISAGTGIILTPNPIVSTGTVQVNTGANLTWTGTESFTGPIYSGPFSVSLFSAGAAGGNVFSRMFASGASLDHKLWTWEGNSSGQLLGLSEDDVASNSTTWVAVTKGTGKAIGDISLGNATDNPTFNLLGTGTVSGFGNLFYGTRGSPLNSSAAPNAHVLQVVVDGTGTPGGVTQGLFITNVSSATTASGIGIEIGNDVVGHEFYLGNTSSTFTGSPLTGAPTGPAGFMNTPAGQRILIATGNNVREWVGSGVVVGAPGGADKGAGSLNAETLWQQGVQVPKFAYAQINGTAGCAVTGGAGVASCSRVGAGNYTVTFSPGFASTSSYACTASATGSGANNVLAIIATSATTASVNSAASVTGTLTDGGYNVICTGT